MSQKQKVPKPEKKPKQAHTFDRKDALFQYTIRPEMYPRSVMVDYDEDFVLIRDMYPKSTLHLLLIPRDLAVAELSPCDALTEHVTALIRRKLDTLGPLLTRECERLFGVLTVPNHDDEQHQRQQGWMDHLRIGVHAVPSMNHVHVHIMTPDLCGTALKTRAHYQSFATPFFIPLNKFPLSRAQVDEIVREQAWKKTREMRCLRCAAEYIAINDLKRHLATCWQTWLHQHVRKPSTTASPPPPLTAKAKIEPDQTTATDDDTQDED